MRLIPVSKQAVGQVLARTLYTEFGDPLLKEGVELTDRYIEALQARGIQGVYVKDPYAPDLPMPEDALSDRTRRDATVAVRRLFSEMQNNPQLPVDRIRATVQAIIDDVMSGKGIGSGLSLLRDYDEFTFTHSVNVCTYAVALGLQHGLDRHQLIDLGSGALLHDIGKIRFSEGLIEQPVSSMDPDQLLEYQQHAVEGYNMIRASTEMSLLAAHVAYQHHEHWDGSGFPRGRKAEEIHLYARITAIANAFDGLCSRRTGAEEPLPPHRAAGLLLRNSGKVFDPRLVPLFIKQQALFPVGTLVRLSNGFFGVVSRTVQGEPVRPWVRVIADKTNHVLEPFEVSLVENPHLSIERVFIEYPEAIRRQLRKSEETARDDGQVVYLMTARRGMRNGLGS